MKIFESKYKSVAYQEDKAMMVTRWHPDSIELDESTFKTQIKAWLSEVKRLKPSSLLIDTTHFGFIIEPTVQDWFDQEVFTAYAKAGVQKKAFLVSKDVFSQVALKQHISELRHRTFEVAFFASEAEAMEWLDE
ncbi:MAG TPA: hypothetical protein DCS93_36850 [Microscillaceae bacterium]|nr:hypothetical protein [Microscillaceae bacterium]